MNMTPEQAEKSARLQAKLRSMDACEHSGEWYLVEPTAPPPDGILPVCFSLTEHAPALDPFDPADMWELVKLAESDGLHGPELEAAQATWFKLAEEQGDD